MLKLSNKIKMVVSDFDGVFTDGSIYISEKNEVQKKLNFKDIMGVSLLVKAGIKFGIISGEKSEILNYFKDKFNLEEIHGGIRQKGIVLDEIMKKYNLKSSEVLYIGDDINDIECLSYVRFPVSVREANKKVLAISGLQLTEAMPGNGAFREIVDNLIEIRKYAQECK